MIGIKINNKFFFVKKNISLIEACKFVGITVPRFCYHENLSIAGNCRMCLVEVEPNTKPVSACTLLVSEDLSILTETPFVKKARENVLEMLLLNHPLDCPICDQGGECDLQDQTKEYGIKSSRFFFEKRGVEDKNINYFVKTIMTRCIHCTRCVRFSEEVLGKKFLGTLNRGQHTEIGTYILNLLDSNLSGNVIDLCPVGALTSKTYAFKARPWELKITETIDLTDSVGANIFVSIKESDIVRITPKKTSALNTSLISDITRFSYDALNNLRISSIYFKQRSWEALNTSVFLSQFQANIGATKNIFLVNEELEYNSLHTLKTLAYTSGDRLKIASVNFNGYLSNIYYGNANSQISDLEKGCNSVFIFGSNIKLENSILNSKLRAVYLKKTSIFFSTNFYSSSLFAVNFIAIKATNIIKFFESKKVLFALKSIMLPHPVIIFGSTFYNRKFKLSLISNFQKILPTVKIFNLNKSANTEGNFFFHVPFINTNQLLKSKNLLAFNLNATLLIHKIFKTFQGSFIYWFNSYSPHLVKSVNFLIPTLTMYELSGTYLNFEGKAQKAQKSIVNLNNDAIHLQTIAIKLQEMYTPHKLSLSMPSVFTFFSEMCLGSTSFESNIFIKSLENFKNISFVSTYPIKPSFEDAYQTNAFTKNSLNMFKRSKEIRAFTTNFFKI